MIKIFFQIYRLIIAFTFCLLVMSATLHAFVLDPEVSIVTDRVPGLPAVHGLNVLTSALSGKKSRLKK